jgi:hypothetical protein
MKARILIILSSWFVLMSIHAHPIHVTVVNLDYMKDSDKIDFSVRLFYDDFQSLINYKYNTLLDFKKLSRMTYKEQQAITDYIRSTFILTDENKNMLYSEFKGWKLEDMSVWLYFCAKTNPEIRLLQMRNTLMLDLFVDQKNLVIARIRGDQLGFEFDRRIVEQRIDL